MRQRHWTTYIRFCDTYKLDPTPCDVFQAASYIAYLGLFMRHASVVTYYQAVLYGHRLSGLEAPSVSTPMLRDIFRGLLNLPDGPSVPKDPLRPSDLKRLFVVLPLHSNIHFLVWVALLLMFRALLRVSHNVKSPHTLTRSDVKFYTWGLTLRVRSAKNLKHSPSGAFIPIVHSPSPNLFPVHWLKELFTKFPAPPSAPLFSTKKWLYVSYSKFTSVFKDLCKSAGLSGNYGTHSLRRGGVSALAELGVPISDIKSRGLWSSDCVNRYIQPTVNHLVATDVKFSSLF